MSGVGMLSQKGYDMDADESGSLSLEEMLQGYDDSGAFSKLMGATGPNTVAKLLLKICFLCFP